MTELPSTAEAYVLLRLHDAESKVERLEARIEELEVENRALDMEKADLRRLVEDEPQTVELKD